LLGPEGRTRVLGEGKHRIKGGAGEKEAAKKKTRKTVSTGGFRGSEREKRGFCIKVNQHAETGFSREKKEGGEPTRRGEVVKRGSGPLKKENRGIESLGDTGEASRCD